MSKASRTDRSSARQVRRGREVILVVFAFVTGAVAALVFGGGGWFQRAGASPPQSPAGGESVTFGGAAPSSKGPASETMIRILDSDEFRGIDRTRDVLAFVDAAKPGDYATLIDEAHARRKGNRGYDLIRMLYEKWVEKDRSAALLHAEGLKGRDRTSALSMVLSAWAAKEPHETLAWIEECEDQQVAQSARYAALRTIALSDPEAAIELARRSKGPAFTDVSFLYGIWAEKDPRAAAAGAMAVGNMEERRNALRALSSTWARSDPKAVWEWGANLEHAGDRSGVFHNVISSVANDGDTDEAIAFLEAMPRGEARSNALQSLVSVFARSDPAEAFELVLRLSVTEREHQAATTVLAAWANSDPVKAFDQAMHRLDPGGARNSAIQSVIDSVARRDPALARDLLSKVEPEVLEKISYSVANQLAQIDRQMALAWAEGLPEEGSAREDAIYSVYSVWSREAPEEACTYGATIADDNLRQRSLGSALRNWAAQDAVEAMTWAVQNLKKADQENLIPQSLLGNWVGQDAAAAAEWVAALPEGSLRRNSVSSLVSNWADDDLVATGEWIQRLPKGETRDEAARRYASRVYETDPEAALAWAESIGKESTRFREMENYAGRYLRQSRERAERWITGSSLPPQRIEDLLRQAK